MNALLTRSPAARHSRDDEPDDTLGRPSKIGSVTSPARRSTM